MQNGSFLEQYHVDPNCTVHLVVPRSCVGKHIRTSDRCVATANVTQTSDMTVRIGGQSEDEQRAQLAAVATARVAASICGGKAGPVTCLHCKAGRNHTQCDHESKDLKQSEIAEPNATTGRSLYRTLGRSHLRRCRSLSETRRGTDEQEDSKAAAKPEPPIP